MEKHAESQSGTKRENVFGLNLGQQLGHHFGQKLGRKLGKEIGRKGEAIGQKFDERVELLTETVTTVAQSAKQTAKTGLDQILLNLDKRGLNLKESDLLQKVSQTVLDRAEKIRTQIVENPTISPIAPSWIKEPFVKAATGTTELDAEAAQGSEASLETATADAASSVTDATVSEPATEMQTPSLQAESAETTAAELMGDEGATTDSSARKTKSTKKASKAK